MMIISLMNNLVTNQDHNTIIKMQNNEISISMPEIASQKYKVNMKEIEESVKNLNGFTNNLEQKVSLMLKGQQTEFVNSYKLHMFKIEQALKEYQRKIEDYRKRVDYYENEGVLATLLTKINFMEKHEKKLLSEIDKKDHIIATLKREIKIQDGQIKSLQQKVKQLLKIAIMTPRDNKLQKDVQDSPNTFATEVHTIDKYQLKSNQSLERINQQFLTISNPENSKEANPHTLKRVNQQLETLKQRNRHLSSVNSKIIERTNQVQQFFIKAVNDIKRKISVRKNFKSCSYEQFKQEDKLELLVKILSNEDVLKHLYNKIFSKLSIFENNRNVVSEDTQSPPEIHQLLKSERVKVQSFHKFPMIPSKRLYR